MSRPLTYCVGWVERSDTHQLIRNSRLGGYRSAPPTLQPDAFCEPPYWTTILWGGGGYYGSERRFLGAKASQPPTPSAHREPPRPPTPAGRASRKQQPRA